MTDRFTKKDMEQIKKRVGEDRVTKKDIEQYLQEKGLEIMNREDRNIRDSYLQAIGKGAKKLKQEGFSMGGMADYIKDLLWVFTMKMILRICLSSNEWS